MDLSRHLLVGLALLGLPLGLAVAAEPGPPSTNDPAVSEAITGAPAVLSAPPAQPPLTYAPVGDTTPPPADPAGRSGIIGGVGLYILQPYFSNNTAYAVQQTLGRSAPPIPPGSPGTRIDNRFDIGHHMEAAPQVWLGYIADNGLGVRARWWYFREGSDQSIGEAPVQGANGILVFSAAPLGLSIQGAPSLEVTSKLELQVADLEALDEINAGNWNILLAGGLRIAQMNQTYNAFSPLKGMTTLLSSDAFQGVGPTLALEVRRTLGSTGISVYGSARGAFVFGSAHQSAVIPDQNVGAEDHRDVGMPIGEMELGLEYSRNVGQSRLFGQVALVGQEWFGAGSASRSSINVTPGGAFVGAAYTGDSDIDFLGLSIRLGVNY